MIAPQIALCTIMIVGFVTVVFTLAFSPQLLRNEREGGRQGAAEGSSPVIQFFNHDRSNTDA